MLWIDKKENERINEEKNKHDMDVQRFNNKFVLYEGENIEFDILKKLLITAGKNMKEYVVEEVNGKKQLKLIIQSGNKNEAATNKIIQSCEKSRNTYNIKMEYSDDGYINAIDISVYENKWLNIICGSLLILDGLIITFFVREDCMFKNINVIKEEKEHDM